MRTTNIRAKVNVTPKIMTTFVTEYFEDLNKKNNISVLFSLGSNYQERLSQYSHYQRGNLLQATSQQLVLILLLYKMHKVVEGYPLYIKGDVKIIERIKLTLYTTIALPKNSQISVPFIPKSKQITPLLEPVIYLQIIDEPARQMILKGKYQLRTETFYLYFPTQFRVDEKIYRSLSRNFQNLIDELPRNIKPYMHKLIFWQQGKGDHSIQMQKQKINESLSEIAKQLIETKLNSFISDIKQYQSQPSTHKSLLHIFLLKNKLACLYSHLLLNTYAYDLINDVWNQMMINFRILMRLSSSSKGANKLQIPADIPKAPYYFQQTIDVLGYFQDTNSSAYLRIVTHSFLNLYIFALNLGHAHDALSKLKLFVDYILNNILVLARRNQWTKQQMKLFDIGRNLWAIELITKCLKQIQKNRKSIREQQISKARVNICSVLRNSIQRVGLILYQFNNYTIFPGNIQKEVDFVYKKLILLEVPWKESKKTIDLVEEHQGDQIRQKTKSLMRREQFVLQVPQLGPGNLKLKQLIGQKLVPPTEITRLLINFESYSQVYLEVLQSVYISLKLSPFTKIARSLKLTLDRATIMLGGWQDYQKAMVETQQFKGIWGPLYSTEKLYKLFFQCVNVLTGKVENNAKIENQLVSVLKDKQLQKCFDGVVNIAEKIIRILDSRGIVCNIGSAKVLLLVDQNKFVIVIEGQTIHELLEKSQDWILITEQRMIEEGKKTYNIEKVEGRLLRRCHECESQCSNLCMNQSKIFTELNCYFNKKEVSQAFFKIQSFLFSICASESKLNLNIQLSEDIKSKMYQINTPSLKFDNKNKNNSFVFAQTWTPFRFELNKYVQPLSLRKIKVWIEYSESQLQKIILQDFASNSMQQISQQQTERKKQVEISKVAHVQKYTLGGQQQNEQNNGFYFTIDEQIQTQVQNTRQTLYLITIFAKVQKRQKIKRASRNSIGNTSTNSRLVVSLELKSPSLGKSYQIQSKSCILYIAPLLQIDYSIVQTFQQFMLTNTHDLSLEVYEHSEETFFEANGKGSLVCQLKKQQSMYIESRLIQLTLYHYHKITNRINLNDWFHSGDLLQQKSKTFKISYEYEHSYHIFKPIRIESEIIGQIEIPFLEELAEQGVEIVGKVKGQVKYIDKKFIDIWAIATITGNLVLPEIYIDGKRGIWVNSLIGNVGI